MIDVHTHLAAVQRLNALIETVPESAAMLQPYIDWHQAQIVVSSHSGAMQPRDALAMREAGWQALEQGLTLNVTTGQESKSRAFWPDVRIDPPYDR